MRCEFPTCTPTPALVLAAFKFDHDRSRANGAFRALAEIGLAVAFGMVVVSEYLTNDYTGVLPGWAPETGECTAKDMAVLVRALVLP
jgi:hypothetical protein